MFGRKKQTQRILRLWDGAGQPLYDGPLQVFALPEDVVLRLSTEFFADPEPCHIHRAAVHSRVCLGLCGALEGHGQASVLALPGELDGCFGAYPGASAVELITS